MQASTVLLVLSVAAVVLESATACRCVATEPGKVFHFQGTNEAGCGILKEKIDCPGHEDEYCMKSATCCEECDGFWEPASNFDNQSPCDYCEADGGTVFRDQDNDLCCKGSKSRNRCE